MALELSIEEKRCIAIALGSHMEKLSKMLEENRSYASNDKELQEVLVKLNNKYAELWHKFIVELK